MGEDGWVVFSEPGTPATAEFTERECCSAQCPSPTFILLLAMKRAAETPVDTERDAKRARSVYMKDVLARCTIDALEARCEDEERARLALVDVAAVRVWEYAFARTWSKSAIGAEVEFRTAEVNIEPGTPKEICDALHKLIPRLQAYYAESNRAFCLSVHHQK
jgi:hypothetical protein